MLPEPKVYKGSRTTLILSLHDKGHTAREIAEGLGCTSQHVYQVLHRRGLLANSKEAAAK